MSNIKSITAKGKYSILEILQIIDGENHRSTVYPNDDLTGQPSEVLEAAQLHHTDEIKAAWQANLDSKKPAPLTAAEIITNAQLAIKAIRNAIYAGGDAGQVASYQHKLEQAKAYIAAGYPTPIAEDEYVYLVEGVKDRSFSERGLADEIVAAASAYELMDAKIEAARTIVADKVGASAEGDQQAAADLVVSDLKTALGLG